MIDERGKLTMKLGVGGLARIDLLFQQTDGRFMC